MQFVDAHVLNMYEGETVGGAVIRIAASGSFRLGTCCSSLAPLSHVRVACSVQAGDWEPLAAVCSGHALCCIGLHLVHQLLQVLERPHESKVSKSKHAESAAV